MNKVILKRVVAISLLAGAMCCHAAGQYEDRWFYVSRSLTKQEHVREIANIVKTAKAADLNGMLFACGVERWNNWPADRRKRLVEVKHLCDAAGIEIIPIVWSVGYGGHDPAYAAALPCTGMKFTAKGGKAVFAGGGACEFANPGFDDPTEKPNRAPGWDGEIRRQRAWARTRLPSAEGRRRRALQGELQDQDRGRRPDV